MRKRKTVVVAALIFSTLCSLVGCGKRDTKKSKLYGGAIISEDFQRDTKLTSVQETTNEYNFDSVSELVDMLEPDGGNVIFSDTSLNLALGLLLDGADGNCYNDIYEYLDRKYMGRAKINYDKRYNELMNSYYNSKSVDLKLSNSVWTNEGVGLYDDYKLKVAKYYNASASVLDFKDPKSADIINGWCSDATEGLIPEIIDPGFLASQENILINALYFNGTWDEPFEKEDTREEYFTHFDGSTEVVDMMRCDLGYYYENDEALAFVKYYKSDYMKDDVQIGFVGILPKEEGDFTMAGLDLNSLLENRMYADNVYVHLPKFKVEDSRHLLDPLMEQGLASIKNNPDFSKMAEMDLKVSDIIQKTYVDVNEDGTEAAAVTVITMDEATCADPEYELNVEIYLDRPFAFMIYDFTNDEVLFIGKITTLEK